MAYLNADHEVFHFDSAGTHIVKPQPMQELAETMRRLVTRPWVPGRGVSTATFMFNTRLNEALGHDPWDVTGFLIVNVLVHAINACLVYGFLRSVLRLLGADEVAVRWVPVAMATLFAVHPMNASSVAYIVQRAGALATTFYLLAVWGYVGVRRPPSSGQAWTAARAARAAGVLLCFWLSIKSKPLGLTLPVMILMLEACLLAPDRVALRRFLRVLVPGVAVAVAGMLFFVWWRGLLTIFPFQLHPLGGPGALKWGAWEHFLTESRVFVHYWKLLLLPLPQWSCIDHDVKLSTSLFEHLAVFAILFHAGLLVLSFVASRRGYVLAAFGVQWFYVALIPYVALAQYELMVEYKTYLPCVGFMLVVAEGLWRIQRRVSMRWLVPIVAASVAVLLAITVHRNTIYQTPLRLWTDAVEKSPGRARPHYNLGNALAAEGRLDEAIDHYRTAVQLDPTAFRVYNNLGLAFMKLQRFDDAIAAFREGLRLRPDFVHVHNNLATVLVEVGRRSEALEHYREAFRLRSDYHGARFNYAVTLQELGETDAAQRELESLVAQAPGFGQAYARLADLAIRRGETEKAITYYRQAVARGAAMPELHAALGDVFLSVRRFPEAIKACEEAIRMVPDHAWARNSLAAALLAMERTQEALACLTETVRLCPDAFEAHMNRGQIYRNQGEFSRALADFDRAIELKPDSAVAYRHRGLTYAGMNDAARATQDLHRAIVLDPDGVVGQQARQDLAGLRSDDR
ncbi:MAG: tetratricopeptide repeat protein [Phycisphaerae bacterium]|nr:tetratricopeptide repeat protein [Phycisphaerae bacterium]